MLKAEPPFALVEPREIKKTVTSSFTTGQMPSRVALDSPTARRMGKAVVAITQDFLGRAADLPGRRCPRPRSHKARKWEPGALRYKA